MGEVRHRRLLIVVVGLELPLHQSGPGEAVDLVAVEGDGQHLALLARSAAAARHQRRAAGRHQSFGETLAQIFAKIWRPVSRAATR